MSAYAKLRRKRQLFVDAYVRTGSQSEAAIASGYSGKAPNVAGCKLMANPEVKAAYEERKQEAIERSGMRPVRMLEELALLALASNESIRGEDGNPRAFKDLPPEYLRATESIDFNPDGSVRRVRLAKTAAINMALQHLKLLTQVLEHQGKDGGPIETHEVSNLEKARRIAHVLAQGLRSAPPATVLSDGEEESNGESGA